MASIPAACPTGAGLHLTATRHAWVDAINQCRPITKDTVPIRITVDPDEDRAFTIGATTRDHGSVSVTVGAADMGLHRPIVTGANSETWTVAFNAGYLLDAVSGHRVADDQLIEMTVLTPLKPATLTSAGTRFGALVMPVRL